MTADSIYTVADIARWCGCSHRAVHVWIEEGTAPDGFRTPGGHWRFHAADIRSWMAQRNMKIPKELMK